jgi:hypothetical protein
VATPKKECYTAYLRLQYKGVDVVIVSRCLVMGTPMGLWEWHRAIPNGKSVWGFVNTERGARRVFNREVKNFFKRESLFP